MKSPKVTTVDLQSQITAASVPFKFPCFTNKHKQVNGAFSPINDAHYFANIVYRMFHDWYNIDLLNVLRPKDAPHLKALEIRVHYGIGVENAYWQGNAALFGDGGQKYYPMVSLDFVGHEIGHGYTEYTSNLQPGGQPGAIAEAFSDMAGETAESYAKNGAEPDFLVAPSLVKEAGAMRYICDPKRDMKSIHHASEYTSGMDPHHAAGIFNRAFCLLAKTPGWNVRKAFHVFLNAQKGGWNLFSDFAEAAEVAVEVADQDLGFNPADVRNAFVAVGVL
jgi:Zn-dependent metalloprotease